MADPEIPEAAVQAAAGAIEDRAMELIGRDLGTIHRNEIVAAGIAAALPHLVRDSAHVVTDPAQNFGRPIMARSGTPVDAVTDLLAAGETIATVIEEYGLRREDVLVAVWYAGLYGDREQQERWNAWAHAVDSRLWHRSYDSVPDPRPS